MSVLSHARVQWLLILFLQTPILASDLDCTYNTRGIMFCSWKTDSQYITAPCNVSAKAKDSNRHISGSCMLSLGENPRHCAIRFTYNGVYHADPLTVGHKVNTSVICASAKAKKLVTNILHFKPYDNVCLDPPESLNIRQTDDGKWNLTWIVYSNKIRNINTSVHYKPLGESWQNARKLTLVEKEFYVLLLDLKPDTLYEARARVKPKNGFGYEPGARWSNWSQPIQWRTPPEDTIQFSDPNLHVTVVTPLIVTMVVVTLFLLIILNQERVKKIIWIGVPNPSSFFDPLMSVYKGNFQKWLSSPFPFSSFSPEPCPPDISPLDVNWNMEKHNPKSVIDYKHENQPEKNIHCISDVSNKGYFAPNCLIYDNVKHQDLQTIASQSSSSPTEELPLFHADYLCAPLSLADLGFHNKSFELDVPQRNMQMPILVDEAMGNAERCSLELPETEEVFEEEENDDFIESPGACSTAALVFHDVQPATYMSDNSSGYFSLNELHQKHSVHCK